MKNSYLVNKKVDKNTNYLNRKVYQSTNNVENPEYYIIDKEYQTLLKEREKIKEKSSFIMINQKANYNSSYSSNQIKHKNKIVYQKIMEKVKMIFDKYEIDNN